MGPETTNSELQLEPWCARRAQSRLAAATAEEEGGEARGVAALRGALDDVREGVRAALAAGTLQCAPEPGEDPAAAAAAAVAAQKAELRARLAALQAVRARSRGIFKLCTKGRIAGRLVG